MLLLAELPRLLRYSFSLEYPLPTSRLSLLFPQSSNSSIANYNFLLFVTSSLYSFFFFSTSFFDFESSTKATRVYRSKAFELLFLTFATRCNLITGSRAKGLRVNEQRLHSILLLFYFYDTIKLVLSSLKHRRDKKDFSKLQTN